MPGGNGSKHLLARGRDGVSGEDWQESGELQGTFKDCSICYTAEEILGQSSIGKRSLPQRIENKMRRLARTIPEHLACTVPIRRRILSGWKKNADKKEGKRNYARHHAS